MIKQHGKKLWLALLLTLLGTPPAGASAVPCSPWIGAVWIAQSEGVLQIGTADGRLVSEIPWGDEVRAVAADPHRRTVWFYSQGTLHAYGFDGEPRLAVALGLPDSVHSRLALDPEDGGVWLAVNRSLLAVDPAGQVLHSLGLPGNVEALDVDPGRSLVWVATRGTVRALDRVTAFPAVELDLGRKPHVEDADVDRTRGEVVVALRGALRRHASDGALLGEAAFAGAHLVASDQQGGAWVATKKDLVRMDGAFAERVRVRPLGGEGKLQDLVVDPDPSTVWIANQERVAAVDSAGTLLRELSFDPPVRIRDLDLVPADLEPPTIEFVAPEPGAYLGDPRPELALLYDDDRSGVDADSLDLTSGGSPLAVDCSADESGASCLPSEPFDDGAVTVRATIADCAGNRSQPAEVSFTVDTIPPEIFVEQPPDGFLTNVAQVLFVGSVSEPASLTLDGEEVAVGADLRFAHGPVPLAEGANAFELVAVDRAGNVGAVSLTVVLDTVPPPPIDPASVSVGPVAGGTTTVSGQPGSAEPAATVTVTNLRTGDVASTQAAPDGSFSVVIAAAPGDLLSLVATDAAGNASAANSVQVPAAPGGGVPPDPSTVAPPLDRTVATEIFDATRFLWDGSPPIQTGVDPGTIEPVRVAVLRGRVLDLAGAALPGAEVTVLAHGELGKTLSREDGRFDLVVNGGGALTLAYRKDGFVTIQRTVEVPWREFVPVDDVRMIPLDDEATAVAAGAAEAQVARGSVVTDDDGTRQATVLIPENTRAEMVFADGTRQPLSTLTVRATEYTVGDGGLEAMPAELPPTSGFTYAFELTVDEALAAGAESVVFDDPVYHYVENFLGFPVGGIVPVGFYDRAIAAWVPADNGRVIRILGVTPGGLAEVDVDGSGLPADPAALAALGFTDSERRRLADLYAPGQDLWRVPIPHFTPWDCNWPYGPPEDAEPPERPEPKEDDPEDDPCEQAGSTLQCQNQVLGEAFPITDSPYSLVYRSDRVPGRKAANRVEISLTGADVPPSLKRVDLEIDVAGRKFQESFAPAPDLTHTFDWDGRDAYGREVQGRRPVTIRVDHAYDAVYQEPDEFERSFSRLSGVPFTGVRGRREFLLSQSFSSSVGVLSVKDQKLGGWTLDVHHAYDPPSQTLLLGDGRRRSLQAADLQVQSFRIPMAGNACGMQVVADGTLWVADCALNVVRTLDPAGNWSIVAGRPGNPGYEGDGGPATDAKLRISDLEVAPDGSFFTLEGGGIVIRRVGTDGIIDTWAGGAVGGYGGDGGPVGDALIRASDLLLDPEGNLLIADAGNHRVRKVTRDGIITTIVGTGVRGGGGDGGPALQAQLEFPRALALDRDGNLYISEINSHRVRKVGPDGIITRYAGTGVRGSAGDGGPANQAQLNRPTELLVDPLGNLYIGDRLNFKVRLVTPDGGISTLREQIGAEYLAREQTGAILTTTAVSGNTLVSRLVPPFPSFGLPEIALASEDGRQLYYFDPSGRHLRTLDTLTGVTLHAFEYDAMGLLARVVDSEGRATEIERASDGRAERIVAPSGAVTELEVSASTLDLVRLADPLGNAFELTYAAGGLLETLTDPLTRTWEYAYDSLGRLVRERDPLGGEQRLERTELSDRGYRVEFRSAADRVTRYTVESLATRQRRVVTTTPAGHSTETLFGLGGSYTTTYPNGTRVEVQIDEDSRFGLQSPIADDVEIHTPAGLRSRSRSSRTIGLFDPEDPLSIFTLTDTTSVNGRTYRNHYQAASRQFTMTSPVGRQRFLTLDEKDRMASLQVSGFEPIRFEYDALGRVVEVAEGTGADERRTRFGYGADQRVASLTGPEGRQLTVDWDAAGRPARQGLPSGVELRFTYDAGGNLRSLEPPGRPAHTFTYSPFGLLETYTAPAVGGTPRETVFSYDADRQLARIDRPDGRSLVVTHDLSGRPDAVSLARGDVDFSYDPATGQLSSLASPDGVTLDFVQDGSLLTRSAWSGAVVGTVERTYDNNFRVVARGVNGQPGVDFQYDNDGYVTRAGDLTLTRDPANASLTASSLGQIASTYAYNEFAEVREIATTFAGSDLFSMTFERDRVGKVTRRVETVDAVTRAYDYTYDDAGRLSTVDLDGTRISEYVYDANGNRLRLTTPSEVLDGTYDDQDRLLTYGDLSYEYAASGELARKTQGGSSVSYEYDELGNLIRVDLASGIRIDYLVDGRNRRVGKKVAGALVQGLLYKDRLNPVAELDGAGALVARFVYASKQTVPDYMEKAGATYRFLTDHLGSVRLVVDAATGAVAQRLDYDEFGRVVLDTNPGFQPFGFAGGIYDYQTALVRFGARDYDPETGRFTAKDPVLFDGGDANLYRYAKGDPVNLIDPEGSSADVLAWGWGLAVAEPSPGGGEAIMVVVSVGFGLWALWEYFFDVPEEPDDANDPDEPDNTDEPRDPRPPKGPPESPPGDACPKPPSYPGDDPTQAPGPEWEWRGPGEPGEGPGNWYNPETGESLNPDHGHPSHGDHWDWSHRGPGGKPGYRIYPDGRIEPKGG